MNTIEKRTINQNDRLYLKSYHYCIICKELLKIPCVQVKSDNGCNCNVHACQQCMEDYVKITDREDVWGQIRCFICKNNIGNTIYMPGMKGPEYKYWIIDIAFASILDDTYHDEIACQCNWKGSRMNYILKHENECPDKLISCSGCDFSAKRREMTEHQSVCPAYEVMCVLCRMSIRRDAVETHNCPDIMIPCRYCRINVKNKDVDNHETLCMHQFPAKILDAITDINKRMRDMEIRIKNLEEVNFQLINNNERKEEIV